MNCQEGLVEVRSSHGDSHLGGDDFDLALLDLIAKSWQGKEPLKLKDPLISRRLITAAEAAKCKLSDSPFATILEDYLAEDSHLELEVSRNEFEELIQPMLEKTLESIHKALTDAEIQFGNVDKILMVGGSTRIPLVQKMIEHRMGKPVSREVNPDLIVTMGAAIQGGIIAGEDVGSVLVDISTQTFCSLARDMTIDELVSYPIIHRGTPLPVTRSEAFVTGCDNQEKIEMVIHQGESLNPDENLKIGEFLVTGLEAAPAGNIIIVEFSLDVNGMLEVVAKEKSTGLHKTVTIDTRDVEVSFDLEDARKRLRQAFGDEDDFIDISASKPESVSEDHKEVVRAKDLKIRTQKVLEQGVDPEDTQDLELLLGKSLAAIKASDFTQLNDLSDQLEDIIFYLEE